MTQFNPIEEMTLEGFQIVSSNMFIHLPRKSDATCTIWPTRISFSKLALEYLHFCEYIKLQVNPKTKCLLVMPVTSTDKEIIAETYEIKAIKSVTYNFNFDEVDNSLKYTEDFLDEATEKNQEINYDVSEITVILNAKTDIYIGSAEGQIKVECTKNKDNNVYSCPIYLMDFGTDTTLQVYYIDSCGKLTDSGITLKIVHPTQIQITNVSLVEESKCVVNSLQSVTLTSDKPPKSKIYFATLVSSAEPNQEFDLESCTFEGTAITCSFYFKS